MKDDTKKQIEKIIGEMKCPKGFRCYESKFDNLCRARDIGIESYLECLEKAPKLCAFSFSFGLFHLCQCPLRIYISKKLKK
jgi:hypothetical protein